MTHTRTWVRRARRAVNWGLGAVRGQAGRYAALERSLRWTHLSADELQHRQLQALREVLDRASRTVPYWRSTFRTLGFDPTSVRDLGDLTRLPLLTKADIRTAGDRMLAEDVPRRRLLERRTGGSSGEPLRFFVTREEFEEQIGVCLRAEVLVGVLPGDPVAKVWGYGRPQPFGNLLAPLTGRVYLDAYRTSAEDLRAWLRLLRRCRPKMIYGYSRALHELARHAGRTGVVIPGLAVVATTAEKLLPEHRATIESELHCRVIDMYGSHEVPRLASECLHGRMHLAPDAAVVEFLPEARGSSRIVVTSLMSHAMPLIRYDLGDSGEAEPGPCDCGLPFPCMSLDVGKMHHVLILPNGRPLHTGYFFKRIYALDAIDQFQIRHERPGLIAIAYIAAEGQDEAARRAVERALAVARSELGNEVTVEARPVSEIPPTPRGKRPIVVSYVEGDR